MTRVEFLRNLEEMLQDISSEERTEVLQYYTDYFEDAGTENEASVIEEIGDLSKLVREIKEKSYSSNAYQDGDKIYTEYGYREPYMDQDKQEVVDRNDPKSEPKSSYNKGFDSEATKAKQYRTENRSQMPGGVKILLVILLIIFAAPISGALLSACGIVIGIIAAILAFGVALFLTSVVSFVVAGILISIGVPQLFVLIPTGILCIGAGLILAAVSIFLMIISVFFFGKVVPEMARGIIKLVRMPFERRGAVA